MGDSPQRAYLDSQQAEKEAYDLKRLRAIQTALNGVVTTVGFGPNRHIHARIGGIASWEEYEIQEHLESAYSLVNLAISKRELRELRDRIADE